MKKMVEFTILSIKKTNKQAISLDIRINGKSSSYTVIFTSHNIMSLPDDLEILMRHKDFNRYREFAAVITDFKKGKQMKLPLDLLAVR